MKKVSTKYALLIYREIVGIEQRWQRCVVVNPDDADTQNDMLAKGLLHIDLKRPPTPFLGARILHIQTARELLRNKSTYAIP